MRTFALILALLWPVVSLAQSLEVRPGELALTVEVEDTGHVPLVGEQVILTIRGEYRRHITRERLAQPDLAGFNWSQLGSDSWTEERIDGQTVKVFRRRMALYPDRAGRLEIGPFTHNLTLTDEGDDWFAHPVLSDPVSLEVAPAPATDGWWFPVRRLQISDQWSNAPDQLKPGEGVLRVIRLEAHGVTPEMVPPMPDLTSPSAMIFPHPAQRLVELTPEGPVTYAFWRWTIRPGNDVSTIVEPISVSYFDTVNRVAREATISPQRIAYGDVAPAAAPVEAEPPPEAKLPGAEAALAGIATLLTLVWIGFRGRVVKWTRPPALFDPLAYRIKSAARRGDAAALRAAARTFSRREPKAEATLGNLLRTLDLAIFDPARDAPDLRKFARRFLRAR